MYKIPLTVGRLSHLCTATLVPPFDAVGPQEQTHAKNKKSNVNNTARLHQWY
jgi:hypothetical protein